MAKLRAIFTVLVILACVSISECQTEDIKSQLCEKLAAKVEKKQAEIETKTIIEITENVCNLKTEAVSGSMSFNPLEKLKSEGQCNWEVKTTDPNCQEVTKYLGKPKPDIQSLVSYLCEACPVLKQITKTWNYPKSKCVLSLVINNPAPKQEKKKTFFVKMLDGLKYVVKKMDCMR